MKPSGITSKLFAKYTNVVCCVSTRIGRVSLLLFDMNLSFHVGDNPENVKENRNRFFGSLGIDQRTLAIPGQVHGDSVLQVFTEGEYPSCDALITQRQELYLVVSIADCLPIFLYDPETKSIAAVHTGWRGSKAKILSKTIEELSGKLNVQPEHLIAFVGPSAGVCCYEVGDEVAQEFPEQFVKQKGGAKPHLDLKEYNKSLLLSAGVLEQNIEVSDYCTICNPELFHSYRRDGNKSGRMMGVIGMKSKEY